MFSRLFGYSLPPPSSDQINTDLCIGEICRESIALCSAFEPRYKLYGLGLENGKLLVLNKRRQFISSDSSVGFPICKICPLINSSSFFTATSKYLIDRNPALQISINEHINDDIGKTKTLEGTILTHWVVLSNRVVPRSIQLREIINDLAISNDNPNFCLVAFSNGDIRGFSIEEMQFTDLYIDVFKGKQISCISHNTSFSYFVSHSKVEILDIEKMTIDHYSRFEPVFFEEFNGICAIIGPNGSPMLINGDKLIKSIDSEPNSRCIYSGFLNEDKWVVIMRKQDRDLLLINSEVIISEPGLFLIPYIIKNFFDFSMKKEILQSYMISLSLRIVDLMTKPVQIDELIPETNNVTQVLYHSDSFFVFQIQTENTLCTAHTLNGIRQKLILPTIRRSFILNNLLVCIGSHDIVYFNPETINPIYLFSSLNEIAKSFVIDEKVAFLVDNKIFVWDPIENNSIINENLELTNYFLPELVWISKYQEFYLSVFSSGSVQFKEFQEVLFDFHENVVLIDIVDETGKKNLNGKFLIIVTNKVVRVHLISEKFKEIRKFKPKFLICSSTILAKGTLVIASNNSSMILPLPDITHSSLGSLFLDEKYRITMIEGTGLYVLSGEAIIIYKQEFNPFSLFDGNCPPIEIRPKKSFLGLIKKQPLTTSEIDERYRYKRLNSINEIQQTMQQVLVDAMERSEKLAEMEIKANRLMENAKKFKENCKRFVK